MQCLSLLPIGSTDEQLGSMPMQSKWKNMPYLHTLITCGMVLSGGLGAPSIKISNLDLVRTRLGVLQSRFSIRTSTAWTPLNNSGLVISQRSQKAIILCCGSSSEAECKCSLLIHLSFCFWFFPPFFYAFFIYLFFIIFWYIYIYMYVCVCMYVYLLAFSW